MQLHHVIVVNLFRLGLEFLGINRDQLHADGMDFPKLPSILKFYKQHPH